MDVNQLIALSNQPKRKRELEGDFPIDELNQDLLEEVLSWLPTSNFLSLRSVCKRWSSVTESPTFKRACSHVSSRNPWFLMVDSQHLHHTIIYDTSDNTWKKLNHPALLQQADISKTIPVASAGALVCFRTSLGELIVSNPVTNACRKIPSASFASESDTIHAIAMHSSHHKSEYKIILITGQLPHLTAKVFESSKDNWEDEFSIIQKISDDHDGSSNDGLYFLSKTGDVISANMQRSPSKQFSSVMVLDAGGDQIVYFLSSSGSIVASNLTQKSFSEYPRLMPVFFEYSIDLVACGNQMLVVVLSEFLETSSLRVWRFSDIDSVWHQVAAMPPSMSNENYGKKADINCVCHGSLLLVCVNGDGISRCVICNLVSNEWMELPRCCFSGEVKQFFSAFSFEPRFEACV